MKACLFLCLLLISLLAAGQSVSPVVPDFTDITAPWVEATTGNYSNPFQLTGVVSGRHTVITAQGTDPNTGDQLALLPPGETRVVRLGNPQTGAQAESISYRFIVDMEKSVLLLKFAVVMEDPGHNLTAQPRFVVRILNKDGELVESCSEYDVFAGPAIDGFQMYNKAFWLKILWRDWTPVGLDLSALAGQEVQVQFITYDCDYGGHFGYTYFTAGCTANRLQISGCTEPEITLEAPSGFASYTWQDGSIDPVRSVATGTGDINMACEVVSATGCRFTLSAFISSRPDLPTRDTVLYDTICEGDEYHKHFYNLPTRNEIGTEVYYNTFFNPATCSGDVTSTLFLTITQRYTRLEAQICQGEDYLENGFRILQPSPGIYEEKLVLPSETGCEKVLELKLVVAPAPQYLQSINGEQAPCSGTVVSYEVPGVDSYGNYHWEVPEHAYIFSGQGTGKIRVQYTDAATSGIVAFTGVNGCGSHSVNLPVTVNPSSYELYTDSICAGSTYSGHGFLVSPQPNGTFYRTVTQAYKTRSGCDSIRSLELKVSNTPVVEILSQDSVICSGDTVSLSVRIKEGADGYIPERRARVGDVVCMDGSVLSPEEFVVSGKQAKGVVFYVGKGGHGTMVSLHEVVNIQFGILPYFTIPELIGYQSITDMLNDLNGYTNTSLIRANSTALEYPAAFEADIEAGWYIPALGELRQLFIMGRQINETLQQIGGDLFPSGMLQFYWSSTRINDSVGSGFMAVGGFFVRSALNYNYNLRFVASF